MTTRDVAIQMLIQPALDSDDVELLRVFRGRVACALHSEGQGRGPVMVG